MKTTQTPLQRLKHHVTGAIERGEATPIVEQRNPAREANAILAKHIYGENSPEHKMMLATPAQAQHGRYSIKEGQNVLHVDHHGKSEGIADSDAIMSSNRIKVSFSSGIRKGECRWVPLDQVSHAPLLNDDEDRKRNPWPDSHCEQ